MSEPGKDWERIANLLATIVREPTALGMTKDEFYDVYRQFKPEATREEYEQDWREFQAAKFEYQRKRSLQ